MHLWLGFRHRLGGRLEGTQIGHDGGDQIGRHFVFDSQPFGRWRFGNRRLGNDGLRGGSRQIERKIERRGFFHRRFARLLALQHHVEIADNRRSQVRRNVLLDHHTGGGFSHQRQRCGFGSWRRRNRNGGGQGRLDAAQGAGKCHQFARVGRATGIFGQFAHPHGEHVLHHADQFQQGWCDLLFLTQPEIQGLLDLPGDFAEILETDHASAALQGVRGAPDVGQGVGITGMGGQLFEIAFEVVEYFARFF